MNHNNNIIIFMHNTSNKNSYNAKKKCSADASYSFGSRTLHYKQAIF